MSDFEDSSLSKQQSTYLQINFGNRAIHVRSLAELISFFDASNWLLIERFTCKLFDRHINHIVHSDFLP